MCGAACGGLCGDLCALARPRAVRSAHGSQVAVYLIDRLALRVGGEKDTGEEAYCRTALHTHTHTAQASSYAHPAPPCATPPNHTPAPPRHVVARLLGSGAHSHPWLVLCTRAHRDTVGCCSLRVEHVKFDVPEPQLHLNCAPTTRQASTRRSIAPRPPPRTHALYAAGCRRAHALPGGMRVVAGVERCVACAGRRARMCSPR
jgi:hypothetical protein